MFILIVLFEDEVEFTKTYFNEPHDKIGLSNWCEKIMEDTVFHDCPQGLCVTDQIEWFFEYHDLHSYYIQSIVTPAEQEMEIKPEPNEDDILLTPGMCQIIRQGVSSVQYVRAREILEEHQEIDAADSVGTRYEKAVKIIDELLMQFK